MQYDFVYQSRTSTFAFQFVDTLPCLRTFFFKLQIQRTFQSSLLTYVQLNEVLALLKPSKLPMIRQAYSQLVSETILTKKRMKSYFASLPGKSSTNSTSFTNELKEYATVALRSSTPIEPGTANMEAVEAKDIDIALSELLPVVSLLLITYWQKEYVCFVDLHI